MAAAVMAEAVRAAGLPNPIEAFRVDDARRRGARDDARDGAWLTVAHLAWRMATTGDAFAAWAPRLAAMAAAAPTGTGEIAGVVIGPSAGDRAQLALGEFARLGTAGALEPTIGAGAAAVEQMEDAGLLELAAGTLRALRVVAAREGASAVTLGRLIAQEGRVARKLGDLALAAELYAAVDRLGARERSAELRARASIGGGVLARIRGNYPQARTHFGRAARQARSAGETGLELLAHQGMMIVTGMAGDYERSLTHGWAAFGLARGQADREADALVNLAATCRAAGLHRAALGAGLRAAECATIDRVRLPALAGAAEAAAHVGDRRLVAWCTARVERALAGGVLPYETAQLMLVLAAAWAVMGDAGECRRLARAGADIARPAGFHEFVHEADALAAAGYTRADRAKQERTGDEAVAPRLAPRAREIVTALAAFGADVAAGDGWQRG